MVTQLVTNPYPSDSHILRKNLDEKRSSILVIGRDNPELILTLEGYINESTSAPGNLNRNRVRCSIFGNEDEKSEYDIDDLQIYRSE